MLNGLNSDVQLPKVVRFCPQLDDGFLNQKFRFLNSSAESSLIKELGLEDFFNTALAMLSPLFFVLREVLEPVLPT